MLVGAQGMHRWRERVQRLIGGRAGLREACQDACSNFPEEYSIRQLPFASFSIGKGAVTGGFRSDEITNRILGWL